MPYPSISDVASRLRIGESDPSLPGVSAAAQAYIDGLAFVNLPDAVRNEAYIRFSGYLFDAPEAPGGTSYSNAWRNSGAEALVRPWRRRGAGVVESAGPQTTAPAAGGAGVDQVARTLAQANAAKLMPPSPAEAAGGVATAIRGWTASLVRAAINAVVPAWAREGDTTAIPADKLTNAPSSSGLTQAQVDARVTAGVHDWAETANSDPIPAAKLTNAPTSSGLTEPEVDARVAAGVHDWAETGNTDTIPLSKLDGHEESSDLPMRIAWRTINEGASFVEQDFLDGGEGGTRSGTTVPAAPGSDTTLWLGVWIGISNRDEVENIRQGVSVLESDVLRTFSANAVALTVDDVPGFFTRSPNHVDRSHAGNTFTADIQVQHLGDQIDERARAQAEDVTADWAQDGNTDAIPASKLANAPSATVYVRTDVTNPEAGKEALKASKFLLLVRNDSNNQHVGNAPGLDGLFNNLIDGSGAFIIKFHAADGSEMFRLNRVASGGTLAWANLSLSSQSPTVYAYH